MQAGEGGFLNIMQVNYEGVKLVSDAFLPLINSESGRIVNCGSGASSGWLKKQDEATKALFSDPDVSQEALEGAIQNLKENVPDGGHPMNGYGISKACLTAFTMIQAKNYPNLKCLVLSPGFIATKLTSGWGARLTPEEGCVSYLRCLFDEDVVSGYYYGSDGLRSPLTMTRDPGTPEYAGEPETEIDGSKYNK